MTENEPQISMKYLDNDDLPRLKDFSCGNSNMDAFLYDEAHKYHTTGEGITRLLVEDESNNIIGYCTLRCGLWKIWDPDMYDDGWREIPCIEVSRIAVHSLWQHKQQGIRLGYTLMTYIILLIKQTIAQQIGCRLITLYAVPDKVNWYKDCFGFVISNPDEVTDEEHHTIAMHLDLIN